LWEADEAALLLGLPDNVTQIALIPVAYTIGTEFRAARRPAPEEVVFWNSWGELKSAKGES
jgi:ribulose bisphosphate carboxylase small subunit